MLFLPKMNLRFKTYCIYIVVSLFMLSMSTSFTVNLQYGENNSYNEIEHNDCNNNTFNEIKENLHNKVCEKLPQFGFDLKSPNVEMLEYSNDYLKCQFILSYDTPPPEFVG